MLTTILPRIKTWAAGALAVFAAIGSAFLYGNRKGRKTAERAALAQRIEEQNKALQDGINAVAERNHVEDEIASRTDSASSERLRKHWSRD